MFLNSNTLLSMYFFCNSRIHVITLYSCHVCIVLCNGSPPFTSSTTTSNSRRSSWTTQWPRDRPPYSTPFPQVEGTLHSNNSLCTHHNRNHHVLWWPLPLLLPTPTTAAKARARGKAITMAPVTPATIVGAPRRGPPSTIPGQAPS
jgi:hypothetical protein